jgi:nucleoside-diphosphate-sugar epimerase
MLLILYNTKTQEHGNGLPLMPLSLITGATGFIGSCLTELLIREGHTVRCLVRPASDLRWINGLNAGIIRANLDETTALREALADVDFVFHLAGLTKATREQECLDSNFHLTKNLIEAALASNSGLQRFVFVSSQAAAGPSPSVKPIDETQPPRPLTWYGQSKLAAEQFLLEHAAVLPLTIIRPPVVYGPRDTDVLNFIRIVKSGIIPQLSGGEHYLSLIYVKDLALGIFRAALHPNTIGKIYFLANENYYSWENLGQMILSVMGKKGLRISIPDFAVDGLIGLNELFGRLSRKPTILNRQKKIEMQQLYWTCSSQAALNDFGFQAATSIEQGFRETINWYRENKWL